MDSVISDHWVAWVRAMRVRAVPPGLARRAGAGYAGARAGAHICRNRLLDTDYKNGSFLYDVRQEGLLLGFGIRL